MIKNKNIFRRSFSNAASNISSNCTQLINKSFNCKQYGLLCQTEAPKKRKTSMNDSCLKRSEKEFSARRESVSRSRNKTKMSAITDFANPEKEQFCQSIYRLKKQSQNIKMDESHEKQYAKKMVEKVEEDKLVMIQQQINSHCVKRICRYLLTNAIKVLDLSRNGLADEGIALLSASLPSLQLESLSLVSVGLTFKGCKLLIPKISKIKTLTSLDLSTKESFKNSLLHDALVDIGLLLNGDKCNLASLKVSNTGLNTRNFGYICNGISKKSQIVELDISQNEITSEGFDLFYRTFSNTSLQSLNCANNIAGVHIIRVIGKMIGEARGKITKSMKILNIGGTKVQITPLANFFEAVGTQINLQQLNLDNNPLGMSQSISPLSQYLLKNFKLKKLSLSNIALNFDEAGQLVKFLQFNVGIESLNLSKNNIDSNGFKILFQKLLKNKNLKKLYLDSCGITDQYITNNQDLLLNHHFQLQKISLNFNCIHNRGGYILELLISKNRNISSLHLYKNSISATVLHKIEQTLLMNQKMKKWDDPEIEYYRNVSRKQQKLINQLEMDIGKLQKAQKIHINRRMTYQLIKNDEIMEQTKRKIEKERLLIEMIHKNALKKKGKSSFLKSARSKSLFINAESIQFDKQIIL